MTVPTYIDVACFNFYTRQGLKFISFRLTKKGKVDLRDVKKFLGRSDLRVPLRWSTAGIRYLNPDVGWPPYPLWPWPEPPEEYSNWAPEQFEALHELLTRTHPSKWTPEEYAQVHELSSMLARGEGDANEHRRERAALSALIVDRPFTGHQW